MKYFEKIIASKKIPWIAGGFIALILALLIFHAGVVVGSHRGEFGSKFGGPFDGRSDMDRRFRSPFMPNGFALPQGFISNNHGAVGTVSTVSLPTLIMETREGVSQTVLVSTSTAIRTVGRDSTSTTTLSVGDQIVVLGVPDSQGRIDAKFIRILPATQPAI